MSVGYRTIRKDGAVERLPYAECIIGEVAREIRVGADTPRAPDIDALSVSAPEQNGQRSSAIWAEMAHRRRTTHPLTMDVTFAVVEIRLQEGDLKLPHEP